MWPNVEISRSKVDDNTLDSECRFVRDMYSLCLEINTILTMTNCKEKDSANEYTRQARIILKRITNWSIEVMKRCTREG